MSANEKQVGGDHYKSAKIGMPEHWDVVQYLGWDYLVGAATKYLWRLGKKGKTSREQVQDVEKAIHYLEKKREMLLQQCSPINPPVRYESTEENLQYEYRSTANIELMGFQGREVILQCRHCKEEIRSTYGANISHDCPADPKSRGYVNQD